MAEYINPTSLDSGMKGNWQQYVAGPLPFEVDREMQKNQIADQMYQNALQQSNLDVASAQRKGVAEQQTEDILGRMRTDPRFAQAMIQAGINEQLGKGGEGAEKYINAVQSARDTLLGPMFQTKDQNIQKYLLQSGQQQLGELGLGQPTLPQDLKEAYPILQAQNARYRADQEYRMKQDLQQKQLENALNIAKIQAQAREDVARLRGPGKGAGGAPKTLDAAFIQSFVAANGRYPTTQEIAAYLAQKPQYNPTAVGDRKGAQLAQEPMDAVKRQLAERIQQRLGGGAAQPQAGPKGFTSKGGVKFTVE